MRRAILVIVALLAVALPAETLAAKRGQVGGPPTMRWDRTFPSGGKALKTKPIIIARKGSYAGGIELVAYVDGYGCLTIELDVMRFNSASATCHSDPFGGAIEVQGSGWGRSAKSKPWYSKFLGGLSAEVAEVRVDAKGMRGTKRVKALVARPGSEILRRLEQSQPFYAWGVVLPGCISGRRFTARAFGADGRQLATVHDPSEGGGFFPCGKPGRR